MAPVQGVQPSERMRHITICGFSPGSSGMVVLHRDERAAAHQHGPLLGEIQRHDGDVLQVDVLPDVELGPVRERKHAHALARVDAGVEQIPQLGPLVLGVPLAEAVAEGEDALLGAGLLLVAARAPDGRVESALAQRVQQRPSSSAARSISASPAGTGWRLVRDGFPVGVHDQVRPISAQKRSRNSIISRNL